MHWSPRRAKLVTKRTGGWSSRRRRSAATIVSVLGTSPRRRGVRSRAWAAGSMSAAAWRARSATLRAAPPQASQRAQEGGDHLGIELRADAAPQLGQALAVAERRPVGPPARHGVVAVDHAHGAGDQRDLVAGQAVGVAAAVEALVVVAHAGHQLLVEQRPHDLGADAGVLAHELPLFGGERPALEQHAVGHADLADVVQEGDVLRPPRGARRASPARWPSSAM